MTVAARALDALVLAEARHVIAAVLRKAAGDTGAFLEAWRAASAPMPSPEEAALRGRVARARKTWTDAALMLVDGACTPETYACRRVRIERRIARLEQQIVQIGGSVSGGQLPDGSVLLKNATPWHAALASNAGGDTQSALRMFVAEVTPVRLKFNLLSTRVSWTALGRALRDLTSIDQELPPLPREPGVAFFHTAAPDGTRLTAAALRQHPPTLAERLQGLPDAALDALPPLDRTVVRLHLGREDGQPHTIMELARRFNVGTRRVVEILVSVLATIPPTATDPCDGG
jgi:hypothetical protein